MEKILIVGHGSPKKEANNIEHVAGLLHKMIHPECNDDCVRVAYLQFAEPDIVQAITSCIQDGAKKLIIHPYFLSSGMHVTNDIPAVIKKLKDKHPEVEFIYTEPLGIHNKLAQIVLERIRSTPGLKPEEIEKKSFEIISGEIDFGNVPEERLPIIKRVIHATADFEFKNSLVFHPEAIKVGVAAIKAGKDILVDVEMVKTGINKKILQRWGGKVVCGIQDSKFKIQNTKLCTRSDTEERRTFCHEQYRGIKTRAEIGIEEALNENTNIGIIAIGNAPTALLKTIEVLNNSKLRTLNSELLVVGVPVGFVKALESKSLLATQSFPFITNLSRKGGTPVAVAIVNALLKMGEEK